MDDLLPILTPIWAPLAEGVEVTAWPLRLTDGSLLLGVSGEEAAAYAAAVGGELVSAAEEDACVIAAAKVLLPITHWPLDSSPGPAGQSLLVLAQLQDAGGCGEEQILAGACKVWTRDKWMPGEGRKVRPGRAVTYGWHVPTSVCPEGRWRGTRTYACSAPGYRVIQGLSDFHTIDDHADRYSQGVRVRRATL